jgi:hypothetical protein
MANKLLSKDKINTLIDRAVSHTAKGLKMLQEAATQCLLHAEKHHDVTLIARFEQEVKANCKGVVVAGFRKWFEDRGPIKLSVDDKGAISARELKEGEPGFKKYDTTKESLDKPAMEAREVTNRSNRPIEPMSPGLIKSRIKGFVDQIEKASQDGGRGFTGETQKDKDATKQACLNLVNKTLLIMDNVDLTKAPAGDVLEAVTGKADRVSTRHRNAAKRKEAGEAGPSKSAVAA